MKYNLRSTLTYDRYIKAALNLYSRNINDKCAHNIILHDAFL